MGIRFILLLALLPFAACSLHTEVDLAAGDIGVKIDGGPGDVIARDRRSDPVCVPESCAALGLGCGSVPNRCGGLTRCGACGDEMSCREGMCVPGACNAKTCESQAIECGFLNDDCGTTLDCGTCRQGTCQDGSCECLTCDSAECWVRDDTCGEGLDCGGCSGDLGCDGAGSCVECERLNEPNGTFDIALIAPPAPLGESGSFASTLDDDTDADLIRIDVGDVSEAVIEVVLPGAGPRTDRYLAIFPRCRSSSATFACLEGVDRDRTIDGTSYRSCSSNSPPGVDDMASLEASCADDDTVHFMVRVGSVEWESCDYEISYMVRAP